MVYIKIFYGGVFMDDKNEQIYMQYDLDICNVYKNKGIVYLETKDELYAVKAYNYTEKKMELENRIKEEICNKGYTNLDLCIKNRENLYVSQNKYGNKFVIKKWFGGCECNIFSKDEICIAIKNLAELHSKMRNIFIEQNEQTRIACRDCLREYDIYNKELKRVKRYIYNKKKKNRLELDIIKTIDYYYKQADNSLCKLKESNYSRLYEKAIREGHICHGNYTYHSVLIDKDNAITINFERMFYGLQVYDLYCFLRKTMEKNEWDVELGKVIINIYNEINRLSRDEIEILFIMLEYPDKYRKLLNSYFNGKKAWVSIRIMEKLNELVIMEPKRLAFIDTLRKWDME